jgi:hypothetical protein
MISFLRKLFGRSGQTSTPTNTGSSGQQSAQSVGPDEKIEDLYDEFCRTFCFRPGVNFMDYLKAEGHTDLIQWFHWTTPEPEPKAIIRLVVATTRLGQNIWDKKGFSLYHDGSWDRGGGPSDYTKDALSVLAKVLGKPITVGYTVIQDGPIMLIKFEP